MSTADIVRAWKNEDYLMDLSSLERSALPDNPAGKIELRTPGKKETAFTIGLPASKCCSIVIECSASNCA